MNLFLPVSIRISKLGSPRTNLLGTERSLFVHQLPPELPALVLYVCYVTILLTQIYHLGRQRLAWEAHSCPTFLGLELEEGKDGSRTFLEGTWAWGSGQRIRAALTLMPPPKDTGLHRAIRNRSTCSVSIRYCVTPFYLGILNPHNKPQTISIALFYRQGNWCSER